MIGGIATSFILGRRLSLSSPITKLTPSRKILALQIYGLYQTLVSQDAQMEKIIKFEYTLNQHSNLLGWMLKCNMAILKRERLLEA